MLNIISNVISFRRLMTNKEAGDLPLPPKRPREGAACRWHAFSTDRSEAETDSRLLHEKRQRKQTAKAVFFL